MNKIKELRQRTNMSQAAFGQYLNVPKRSIENWESETTKCPQYVAELIEYKLTNEKMLSSKAYAVYEGSCEIKYKDRYSIKAGRTLDENWQDPVLIGTFTTKEQAHDKMIEKGIFIKEISGGFLMKERYIQEVSILDDEIIEWLDIDYDDLKIYVADRNSHNDLGCFNNYKDAENFVNESDKECYIAF